MSTDWNLIFYNILTKHLSNYIDAFKDSAFCDNILKDYIVENMEEAEMMPNKNEVKKNLELPKDLTQVSFHFPDLNMCIAINY